MRVKQQRLRRVSRRLAAVLCLVLILALPLAGFRASAQSSAQPSARTIRVGSFPYPEQLARDAQGNYTGYAFEYLQEIARHTGWRYEFVETTWEEGLAMLERGELDLMGAVMKSAQREERFAFSQLPILSGYGVLATKLSNEVLPYEDFETLNGLVVGAVRSNLQAKNFLLYAAKNHFAPEIRYYSTQEQMEAALQAGAVQAGIFTNILRSEQLRIVAKFGENDSYFVTGKSDTQTMAALDAAMHQIKLDKPYFNSELDEKYYNAQAMTLVSFTRAELDFIANSPPIRCVYAPDSRPLSDYDAKTGQPYGIAAQVQAVLAEKTGLVFETVPARTLAQATRILREGEADVLMSTTYDLSWAQKNNAKLTQAYLTGQTVMVSHPDSVVPRVVAVYDEMYRNEYVSQMLANALEVKQYSTLTECMEAVRLHEADAAFVNSVVMSAQMGNPKYAKLVPTTLHGYTANTCMAVGSTADPMLLSVLNKALGNLSATQMNHIITMNLRDENTDILSGLLYGRPLETVLVVSSVLLAFALVLGALLRMRANSLRATQAMLYTDSLTGYPSYKALAREMPRLLGKKPEEYALVYMDMYRFKAVNDALGYEMGDKVLCAIADTLHGFVQQDERFARVYADTFVLLLHCADNGALAARLSLLAQALEKMAQTAFDGALHFFRGGVYRMQEDFRSLDHACDRANYAKSSIRERFTTTFVFYDDMLRNQIMTEKKLERSMHTALEHGEFVPYYQPKVNVITGEVVGAEALVRWHHPEQGCLQPADFLPFYERNGFVLQIDFAMFRRVCADLKRWQEEGLGDLSVSVNFSRGHMRNKRFATQIRAIVDEAGISPRLLEIEITETVELESVETAVEFVNGIKEQGFLVSIDDYGVGYSSISFLQALPMDVLKLDKTFLENAMRSNKARDIMRHLITAMRDNGIRVICEGIETQEQCDFIVSLNCCFAQGFLYARPLSPSDFDAYLRRNTISTHTHWDLLSLSNFKANAWAGSEDFLTRVMPGWIIGCYEQAGYPIFYISPAFLTGLGYSEIEFRAACEGKYANCVHPDDLPRLLHRREGQNAESREVHLQYRLRKKDGGCLWVRDINRRILTDKGQAALLCVCTDITDVVLLQQKNNVLVETAPGGVAELLLTQAGPVLQNATAFFYTVLGHTCAQMEQMGNAFLEIVDEKNRGALREKLYGSAQQEAYELECRIRHADGSRHWISLRGMPYDTERGRCMTVFAYNIDTEIDERRAAQLAHAKLQLALQLTHQAVFEYDVQAKRMSGYYGLEDYGLMGESLENVPECFVETEFIHPNDVEEVKRAFERIAAGQPYATVEARARRAQKQGEAELYVWTRTTLSNLYDTADGEGNAVGVIENIDEKMRYQHAFVQEQQYRNALTEAALLAYDVNLTQDTIGKIAGTSRSRFLKVFNALEMPGNYTELIQNASQHMICDADRGRFLAEMGRANLLALYRDGVTEQEFEYQRLMPDGRELWISAFLHLLSDRLSGDALCSVHYQDIQARKEAESSLQQQAACDSLTGLLNRSSAETVMGQYLRQEWNRQQPQAFLMIDVDHFKQVNDSFGHKLGDDYLVLLARTLRANLREDDVLARMGGDEFAVLLKGVSSQEAAMKTAQKLVNAAKDIAAQLGTLIESSISIGVALAPQHGYDFESLYLNADKAMYCAKHKSGDGVFLAGEACAERGTAACKREPAP